MADETQGNTEVKTAVSEAQDDLAKFRAMLSDHANHTSTELNKIANNLSSSLQDLERASSDRTTALENSLKEALDWIADEKKAREERDKVKSSTSTMVVPPQDVTPATPPPDPTPPPDVEGGRKGGWKRFW